MQVDSKDREVHQLRAERGTVDSAVEEMRLMLMQSVGERSRLAGEVETAEKLLMQSKQVGGLIIGWGARTYAGA